MNQHLPGIHLDSSIALLFIHIIHWLWTDNRICTDQKANNSTDLNKVTEGKRLRYCMNRNDRTAQMKHK